MSANGRDGLGRPNGDAGVVDFEAERFFARQRRDIMARIEAHEARRRTRRRAGAAAAAAAAIAVAVLGVAGLSGPDQPLLDTAWLDVPVVTERSGSVADPLDAFGAWPAEEGSSSATTTDETENLGILEWDEPLS